MEYPFPVKLYLKWIFKLFMMILSLHYRRFLHHHHTFLELFFEGCCFHSRFAIHTSLLVDN